MKKNLLIPVVMGFQFLFTVLGGGLFVSGLLIGFDVKWDMTLENNYGKIALLMAFFGGMMLFMGIVAAVFLYVTFKTKQDKDDPGAQIS